MNASQFQRIANTVHTRPYGIALSGTTFAEDYPNGLEQGEGVFPLINTYATNYDLPRISPPVTLTASLTVYDEIDAFSHCYPTSLPTPVWRTRTLIEKIEVFQLHNCINPRCEPVFVTGV